jgi:hypothetical protein
MPSNITPSRQHKAAFFVSIRAARTRTGLEDAIKEHVRFLSADDRTEARKALVRRASELSITQAKEMQ